jgi:ribosomal-protein-alanine N-acetyltransferase
VSLHVIDPERGGAGLPEQVKPEEIYGHFPQLQTDNLLLRELRPEDAGHVFSVFSDPEVTRHYDLDTFVEQSQAEDLVERFRRRFRQQIGLRWAIAPGQDADVVLGTCGFNIWIPSSRRALLGYDLGQRHWRQGIMTEALGAVLRFGFETMGLNRVEALVFLENAASHGLLQKLGFRREGVLREYEYLKGCFVDMVMYSQLRSDRE